MQNVIYSNINIIQLLYQSLKLNVFCKSLEELGVCMLTCETGCFSTGMPFKYSTLSFSGGNIQLITGSSFGTSFSRRYRQAFGPASNVYATCEEMNDDMRCGYSKNNLHGTSKNLSKWHLILLNGLATAFILWLYFLKINCTEIMKLLIYHDSLVRIYQC